MDNIINVISRYFSRLLDELGDIASEIDGNGWIIISACLLICGWFWLRGNKIKST